MTDPLSPSFSYEIDVDLPSDRKRVHSFPPDQTRGETVLVRFKVDDDSWIGEFWAPGLRTGWIEVYPWLQDGYAVVLVYGRCYLVNVRRPEQWRILDQPIPIRQLMLLPDRKLALLAGDVDIACYAEEGPLWTSQRLVLDDLKIHSIETDRICCTGYLPWSDEAAFDVDLSTGEPLDGRVKEFGRRIADRPSRRYPSP